MTPTVALVRRGIDRDARQLNPSVEKDSSPARIHRRDTLRQGNGSNPPLDHTWSETISEVSAASERQLDERHGAFTQPIDAQSDRFDICESVPPGPAETSSIVFALSTLRQHGLLVPLVGGRRNALCRPLSQKATTILLHFTAACQYINAVERWARREGLAIASIKVDRSGLSSTSSSSDPLASNLHFDAQTASFDSFDEAIHQAILNVGQLPRQLLIARQSSSTIVEALIHHGLLCERAIRDLPARDVLRMAKEAGDISIDLIEVPSGHVCLFDGRRWPHDGAKLDAITLRHGLIAPSPEPDVVINLLRIDENGGSSHFDITLPFLQDVHDTPEEVAR